MKATVNGVTSDYTDQEINYLKNIYGDWQKHQDTFVFNRMDFVPISEMAEMLGLSDQGVRKRHMRDPKRYPLQKRCILGVYADDFLRYWI